MTAEGQLVDVDEEQHSDLLWAIRGGGPGFPGTDAPRPFAVGHYIGESDIALEHWQRLQEIRRSYDPDRLFHGHFEA